MRIYRGAEKLQAISWSVQAMYTIVNRMSKSQPIDMAVIPTDAAERALQHWHNKVIKNFSFRSNEAWNWARYFSCALADEWLESSWRKAEKLQAIRADFWFGWWRFQQLLKWLKDTRLSTFSATSAVVLCFIDSPQHCLGFAPNSNCRGFLRMSL